MSKHTLFTDEQMKFEMPYVLNENKELNEAPNLFDGFDEPLVAPDPDDDDGIGVLWNSAYEAGIHFSGLRGGVLLSDAQSVMEVYGYEFLYLTDETGHDQVTPTGRFSLVHGFLPE